MAGKLLCMGKTRNYDELTRNDGKASYDGDEAHIYPDNVSYLHNMCCI